MVKVLAFYPLVVSRKDILVYHLSLLPFVKIFGLIIRAHYTQEL